MCTTSFEVQELTLIIFGAQKHDNSDNSIHVSVHLHFLIFAVICSFNFKISVCI